MDRIGQSLVSETQRFDRFVDDVRHRLDLEMCDVIVWGDLNG